MNISRLFLFLLAVLPWSLAHGELPFTFKAGDPIRASELNANFQYLDSLASSAASALVTRRKVTFTGASFVKVAQVPDAATNGWVLRNIASSCSGVMLRIDTDPEFLGQVDSALVLKAGETLYAKCPGATSNASAVGYFMFNEQ